MRRFVEDYPSIDIGLLKRRGLFDGKGARSIQVKTAVGVFEFLSDPLGFVIATPIDQPSGKPQRIEIQTTMLRFGERRYFVCPKTRRRAAKLYYVDRHLASREGHELVHLVTTNRPSDVLRARTVHSASRLTGAALGKRPARGARKKALIQDILAKGDPKWIDGQTARLIGRASAHELKMRTRSETARLRVGASTAFALEAGRHPDKGWTEAEILRELAEPLVRTPLGDYPPLPSEEMPPQWLPRAKLDVRTLDHAGLLEPGKLRAACLRWEQEMSGIISYALLVADFREPDSPYLYVEARDTFLRDTYAQVISVVSLAGRRFLVCPFSGTKRTTLYLREGWFGSDKALNLRPPEWIAPEAANEPEEPSQTEDDEEFPI